MAVHSHWCCRMRVAQRGVGDEAPEQAYAFGMREHGFRRARGDDAVIEQDKAVGVAGDEVEVVRDEQDG